LTWGYRAVPGVDEPELAFSEVGNLVPKNTIVRDAFVFFPIAAIEKLTSRPNLLRDASAVL